MAHTAGMAPSTLLLAILLPMMFWGAYHYYHDRHRPEPVLNLVISLALGVGSFFISRGIYTSLGYLGLRFDPHVLAHAGNYGGLFAYAVLAIGLGEELAKLLPFFAVAIRFQAFDEPLDGIIYGSFIAMGFALAENLSYLSFLPQEHALARGFAGPLVHIVFASLWAYPIGCAHLNKQPLLLVTSMSLAAAAVLHGVYDFVAIGFPQVALFAAALLIAAFWLWRLQLIRGLHATYRLD